jgi:Tol biopolymer transport system component
MKLKSVINSLLMIHLIALFLLLIYGYASAEPTGIIAFNSEREGRKREVYLINADGTNERKWLHDPNAVGMTWSPDGKWVAFSQRNAKQEGNLFVLELRTGKQKNITARWRGLGMNFSSPAWSGDGKWLTLTCRLRDEIRSNICIIKADGDGWKQLTNAADKHQYGGPSWSPDGEKIAFHGGGIFVMDRNGRNRIQLSPKGRHPDWSPDGRKIAFYSNLHNIAQQDIYVMNADGANIVRVTNHPKSDRLPAWSPDGRWIAFMSFRGQTGWDIHVVNANGGEARQVTTHPGNDMYPTWVIPDRSLPVDTRGNRATFWGQLKSERR